ncbi:MAG: hypothetical protein WD355_01285 [Balneolaceae bacterium]
MLQIMNPNQLSRIQVPAGLRRRTLASFQPQRTGGDGQRQIVPGILLLLLPYLLSLSGCNETFEPWIENDRYHFSIYGYLDSSADTQWVRVMPVREDFLLDPEQPIDATVTLEHIETGETVVMSDSLFEYAHGAYAWNFWTTMDLEPEQTYRIRAERSDGEYSQAQTTLPSDFPTPIVAITGSSFLNPIDQTAIYIEEVDHLADVQTVFEIHISQTGERHLVGIPHLQNAFKLAGIASYQVVFDPRDDFMHLISSYPTASQVRLTTHFEEFDARIFVASAGPDYHYFPSIDEVFDPLPKALSNVENGVGYLAGMVSKTFQYRNCTVEGTLIRIPCRLRSSPW